MRFLRRAATTREMGAWDKHTPKNKPVLVYGRHARETAIVEENADTLKKMGYQIFRVPKKFTVLSDRSAKDRNEYNEFLAKEFKGRKVIDLHTSPSGFDGYFSLKFKRNVVGLEIPSHKLSAAQQFGFKHVVRGAFHKHVVHLSGRTTSRGELLGKLKKLVPRSYPAGRQISPEIQAGLAKHLEQLKVETSRTTKKKR